MSDIRVVLAEDNALTRTGFRLLIEEEPGMTCVGEAGTGREVVEICLREKPDIVLMDIRMPEMDGIEATREICMGDGGVGVTTRVIVLTTFGLDEYVLGAIRAGASGFLLKDALPDEVVRAIKVVSEGEALLSPGPAKQLMAAFAAIPERRRPLPPDVTAREREVLVLVGRGRSNHEIAVDLQVSMGTVKTHIGRLLTKLGARDRSQLVAVAFESGLR